MYALALIFIALLVGYFAVPIARQLGYAYGRYGRFTDMLIVLAGTLAIGILAVTALSAMGIWQNDILTTVILGITGALLMVILLTISGVKATTIDDQS